MGDSGKAISFSVDDVETKQAIQDYGVSRGFSRVSDLARVALYEYIRRRAPREGTAMASRLAMVLSDDFSPKRS